MFGSEELFDPQQDVILLAEAPMRGVWRCEVLNWFGTS